MASITNTRNTLINGNQVEFADVQISINGIPITSGCISALSYDWNLEPGVVNTNQVAPTGRTAGVAQPATGSMTWLPGAYDQFVKMLVAIPGTNGTITGTDFELTITMGTSSGNGVIFVGSPIRIDILSGVRITGTSTTMQKGSEEVLKVSKLSIMQIQENGVLVWAPGVF